MLTHSKVHIHHMQALNLTVKLMYLTIKLSYSRVKLLDFTVKLLCFTANIFYFTVNLIYFTVKLLYLLTFYILFFTINLFSFSQVHIRHSQAVALQSKALVFYNLLDLVLVQANSCTHSQARTFSSLYFSHKPEEV